MKARELRDLTDDELTQRSREMTRRLFTLRFQVATGQQENSAGLTQAKREIARIKTILRERKLGMKSA